MKKIGLVAFLCLAASMMWASGCGSSSSGCDLKVGSIHICEAISSGDSTGWDAACKAGGGTSGSCASGGLGTCSQKSGVWTVDVTYYADGGLTADAAKTACTGGGGTWK